MFSGKISVLCEAQKLVIVSVRGDTNRGGHGAKLDCFAKSITFKKINFNAPLPKVYTLFRSVN